MSQTYTLLLNADQKSVRRKFNYSTKVYHCTYEYFILVSTSLYKLIVLLIFSLIQMNCTLTQENFTQKSKDWFGQNFQLTAPLSTALQIRVVFGFVSYV